MSTICGEVAWPYLTVLMAGLCIAICGDWITEWARRNYAAGPRPERLYSRLIVPWSAALAGVCATIYGVISVVTYLSDGCAPRSPSSLSVALTVCASLVAVFAIFWLLIRRFREPEESRVRFRREIVFPSTSHEVEVESRLNRVPMPRYWWISIIQYALLSTLSIVLFSSALAVS